MIILVDNLPLHLLINFKSLCMDGFDLLIVVNFLNLLSNMKRVLLQIHRSLFLVGFIFNLLCTFLRLSSLLCSKLKSSKHILSRYYFSEEPQMPH